MIKAIAYALLKKVKLPSWFINQISHTVHVESMTIAGVAQVEQVKFIMVQLQQVLDDGNSFDDFVQLVNNNKLDISLPKHRLDNIYRTNIQMAYAYGRYQQQQANKDNKPYLKYSAINDNRTRPSHRQLHGTIRHIDDGFWDKHTPPIDFRCRCITVALSKEQAEQQGITQRLPNVKLSDNFYFHPKQYGKRSDKLIAELSLADIATKNNQQILVIFKQIKERLKNIVNFIKRE